MSSNESSNEAVTSRSRAAAGQRVAASKEGYSAQLTAKKATAKKKTAAKKATAKKKAAAKKATAKKTTAKKATAKKMTTVKKATAKKTTTTTVKKTGISAEQRARMIAEAAYYQAERNGFHGDPVEHWLAAEQLIDATHGPAR